MDSKSLFERTSHEQRRNICYEDYRIQIEWLGSFDLNQNITYIQME